MKRIAILLLLICLVSAGAPAQTPSEKTGKVASKKKCPFDITGFWRSDATTQGNPIFFNFAPEGTVILMSHSPETLPQDFEMVTAVTYKLVPPDAPKTIEFNTTRGNDFFGAGLTILEITDYDDGSFTTVNKLTGERSQWTREQTHLYFVTLAARLDPQGPTALAMWTVMDGRTTNVAALGVKPAGDAEGNVRPVFGPFAPEIFTELAEVSEEERKQGKPETIILRFELTPTEYQKSRRTLAAWEALIKEKRLPHEDPYLNAFEFLRRTLDGIEWCGDKPDLKRPSPAVRTEIASRNAPPARPVEFIKAARKLNDEVHISDRAFPWSWRPTIQLPGH